MRRFFILTILVLTVLTKADAQRLEIGLRDNQYAHIGYRANVGWIAGVEQSLLNVKVKEQSGRLFAGYTYGAEKWTIGGAAYYGTEYSGDWQAYGVLAGGAFDWGIVRAEGRINPHNDTGLDFELCYQGEVGVTVWKKNEQACRERVELCASYGNIPEYRMAVKQLRLGMRFTSGNLQVCPMISIPDIDKENGSKHIRVLCSFCWSVPLH